MGFVLWRSVTVLSRFLRARSVARSTSLQDELHLLRYNGLCKFCNLITPLGLLKHLTS